MKKQLKTFSALTTLLIACGLSFSASAEPPEANSIASHTIDQPRQAQPAQGVVVAGPASAAYAREPGQDARPMVTDGQDKVFAKFVRDLERINTGNHSD